MVTTCILIVLFCLRKLITLALSVSRKIVRAIRKNERPDWALRIEKLRDKLKMNQTDFARRLGVSAMAISRWERGVNEPPAQCYIELGKLAGNGDRWFFWERVGLTKHDLRRAFNH